MLVNEATRPVKSRIADGMSGPRLPVIDSPANQSKFRRCRCSAALFIVMDSGIIQIWTRPEMLLKTSTMNEKKAYSPRGRDWSRHFLR